MCLVISFAVLLGLIAVLIKIILDLREQVRGLLSGHKTPEWGEED